jgi:hypothetical protein
MTLSSNWVGKEHILLLFPRVGVLLGAGLQHLLLEQKMEQSRNAGIG